MEKSSQGSYKTMKVGTCDSYYNNKMDIENGLQCSQIVHSE